MFYNNGKGIPECFHCGNKPTKKIEKEEGFGTLNCKLEI